MLTYNLLSLLYSPSCILRVCAGTSSQLSLSFFPATPPHYLVQGSVASYLVTSLVLIVSSTANKVIGIRRGIEAIS